MNMRAYISRLGALAMLAACGGDGPNPDLAGGTNANGTGGIGLATGSSDGAVPPDGQEGGAGTAGSGTTATTGSTSGASNGDGCAAVSEQADLALQPTDVIWAIDDSGSMAASFPAIQQALVNFSNQVSSAGIDAHIVLLTGASICVPAPLGSGSCGGVVPGGPTADSNEPSFLHLNTSFGANGGMGTLLNNHPAYAHMLRPNARTHLVLTEDGGPPMSADEVIQRIEGRATNAPPWNPPLYDGQWVFHGVICATREGAACALGVFGGLPPTTTQDLIARSDGIEANLNNAGTANDPFAELLETLAERVVVGTEISCEIDIPEPSMGQTLDPAAVNVVRVDEAGNEMLVPKLPEGANCEGSDAWSYDDPAAPSQVVLCPTACDAANAAQTDRIDIQFGCETVVLF